MTALPDSMSSVKVPANLPELVKAAFDRAVASGDVNFFATQVTLINVNSIPFQLRFSPALAKKPNAPQPAPAPVPPTPSTVSTATPTDAAQKPLFNPFAPPIPPPMLVTHLEPSHNLILNKFAIIPEHFILATHAFKEQTHLLEAADLEVAYQCIEVYHSYHNSKNDKGGELFVFFNSGPHSGASQPHRHLQLLRVNRMKEGLSSNDANIWTVLAGELCRDEVRSRLPFRVFAEQIRNGDGIVKPLHDVYLRLYRKACEAVLGTANTAATGVGQVSGEASISYNLGMTRDVMVVVPRIAEGQAVVADVDGQRQEVGRLALNGTVLAGTALVKTQAEWDALRAEPQQILEVLGRIGVPNIQAPALL